MNILKSILVVFCATILLFGSCSIEKRQHTSGYHVEWRKSNKSIAVASEEKSKDDKQYFITNEIVQPTEGENLLAANEEFNLKLSETKKLKENIASYQYKSQKLIEECDVIILTNGDEVSVKVLEVGISEVKYLKCDNLNGPSYVIAKQEIFMIKHSNGSKTVLTTPDYSAPTPTVNNNKLTETDYLDTVNSNDKSLAVAVVLWFFLGIIGIHRFYLGHIGIGVLYLLTGGLCGIGWLIDGIMLVTGSLKPKNGDYID